MLLIFPALSFIGDDASSKHPVDCSDQQPKSGLQVPTTERRWV
jgi:hypothetical protein